MNRRTTLLSLLATIIILGLIAGLFIGSIQKALSAPLSLIMATPVRVTPVQAAPVQTVVSVPTAVVPVQGNANTLAQDTFQRNDQRFWGTASDGRTWGGDANKNDVFSIANGVGFISNAQGTLNAVLGAPDANLEVTMNGALNHFNNGKVNLGVVLRWTDANNWYKTLIDGTHIIMLKRVNGVTKTLATVPFTAQDGVAYTLRFRALGAMLFASAWPTGGTVPANWMLNVTDTALSAGQAGIRVLLQNTTLVKITSFSVLPATMINTA